MEMETLQVNKDLTFAVPLSPVTDAEGFNEYGVKKYPDGSIDVVYNAMEPGLRKGSLGFNVRVTPEFLHRVASNFTEARPLQLDHSRSQMANVGQVKDAKFVDGFFRLLTHVPNTGSRLRSDVIADFTHEPPAITDGSVGFGEEFDLVRNDQGELEFVDATMVEFSLTPFPGGYDNGGLTPEFAEAVQQAGIGQEPEPTTGVSRVKARSYARFNDI